MVGTRFWDSFPPEPLGHTLKFIPTSYLLSVFPLFNFWSFLPGHLLSWTVVSIPNWKPNLASWGLSCPTLSLYGGEKGPLSSSVNDQATQIGGGAGLEPQRLCSDRMCFKDIMLSLQLPVKWNILPRITCASLILPVYKYLIMVATEAYSVLWYFWLLCFQFFQSVPFHLEIMRSLDQLLNIHYVRGTGNHENDKLLARL